jgi:anhydro-N-acetylmuramic acid kinase
MALFIGVMSGTSMDSVDAALVELTDHAVHLVAAVHHAWPPGLQERLRSLAAGSPLDATGLAILDAELGGIFAEAVSRLLATSATDAARVSAIGCHGQTIAHAPRATPPATLQLGDANLIAERTGITTVSDFRRRDMAAGGQGAPLAPAFHAAMLRMAGETRIVLNLGGVANITILPGDRDVPVSGFDTGPANCLMDAWTRQHLGKAFDQDGVWAASAQPDEDLLAELLSDPYFALPAPKSTGTQYFSLHWLKRALATRPQADPACVQASLLALTVQSIARATRENAPQTRRMLVCGGGVHNRSLMQSLGDTLEIPIESTAAYGIDPQWMEAIAFAWLARQTLENRPGNLPSVTGAAGPRILGAIHTA